MNAVKEQVSNTNNSNGSSIASSFKEPKKNPERHPRPRIGKTAKDHGQGAKNKNLENKDLRASWQGSRRADGSNSTSFPVSSCNGQRNRYQVTGKGNQVVYLRDAKKK